MLDFSGVTAPGDLTIDPRIYGLPGVAFGGYVAGLLSVASREDAPAKVTFLAPAPLGREVTIAAADGHTSLSEAGTVLAQLERTTQLPLPPRLPTWSEAERGTAEILAASEISHPECFGCGPARTPLTGLRIFTGLTAPRDVVVGAWQPAEAMCPDGRLPTELVWAALDCPGAWARRRLAGRVAPAVTATLALDIRRPVQAPGRIIVVGWVKRHEGRKTWVGSALVATNGSVYATAEALWIDLKPRKTRFVDLGRTRIER